MKIGKSIINGILMVGLVMTMGSCVPSNERFLSNFEQFVNEVSASVDQMSEEDWEKANAKYDRYLSDYEKDYMDTFTWEENQKFGKIQSNYRVAQFMGMMDDADNMIEEDLEVIEQAVAE